MDCLWIIGEGRVGLISACVADATDCNCADDDMSGNDSGGKGDDSEFSDGGSGKDNKLSETGRGGGTLDVNAGRTDWSGVRSDGRTCDLGEEPCETVEGEKRRFRCGDCSCRGVDCAR